MNNSIEIVARSLIIAGLVSTTGCQTIAEFRGSEGDKQVAVDAQTYSIEGTPTPSSPEWQAVSDQLRTAMMRVYSPGHPKWGENYLASAAIISGEAVRVGRTDIGVAILSLHQKTGSGGFPFMPLVLTNDFTGDRYEISRYIEIEDPDRDMLIFVFELPVDQTDIFNDHAFKMIREDWDGFGRVMVGGYPAAFDNVGISGRIIELDSQNYFGPNNSMRFSTSFGSGGSGGPASDRDRNYIGYMNAGGIGVTTIVPLRNFTAKVDQAITELDAAP